MRFQSLKREKPLGGNPAARKARKARLGFDRVRSLAVLSLGGRHGQAHLFAQRAADESAHAVGLPVLCFHDLGQSSTILALQQFENPIRLAAFAGRLGFLSAFGRFLRGASLLGRLALLRRDVSTLCATRALLAAFGCSLVPGA